MISGGIGLIEQRCVFRIPPTRTVVAGGSVVQPEESKRIHVIPAPSSSEDSSIFKFGARIQRSFLLHDFNRNNDTNVLLPLGLQEFGQRDVAAVRIYRYLNLIDGKLLWIKLA